MTDKAYTESSSSFAAAMLARSREGKPRAVDKVVSLPPRAADGAGGSDERAAAAKTADFSSAIDLIHEASEAIRISEQRAEELETQMRGFMEQASEEVRRLNSEIVAREALLARNEEQLRVSEARAHEAETWLVRLHEAVLSAFTPLQHRREPMGQSSGRYEAPRD